MDLGMKKCGKCGEIKKYEEFNKKTNSKDGLQDRCKQCQSEVNKARNKEYLKRHREKKKLKKYPGRSIRKRKETKPHTVTQVASRDLWHNKDNVVYCKGEAIAMATDAKWAKEIVEARNSSTDVTQTVALLKQIKNVLVKDLERENNQLREELARLQVLRSPKQEIPVAPANNGHKKRKLKENKFYWVNGSKLREIIKREGVTQFSFADMIGVSINSLNNWIGERAKCRMKMIAKMAELLEVDVAELVRKEAH